MLHLSSVPHRRLAAIRLAQSTLAHRATTARAMLQKLQERMAIRAVIEVSVAAMKSVRQM
jgi:hypothetical protein